MLPGFFKIIQIGDVIEPGDLVSSLMAGKIRFEPISPEWHGQQASKAAHVFRPAGAVARCEFCQRIRIPMGEPTGKIWTWHTPPPCFVAKQQFIFLEVVCEDCALAKLRPA